MQFVYWHIQKFYQLRKFMVLTVKTIMLQLQ